MRASATGAVDFRLASTSSPLRCVGRDGDYERRARGASLRCISVAWSDCSIFFGDACRKPTAEGIRTRRRVWAAPQLPLKRRGFGWRRPRPSRKLLWDQGYRSSLSPTSILRALRWRRVLSILCSLSSVQSGFRPSCVRTPLSAYHATWQPIFASQARIARGRTRGDLDTRAEPRRAGSWLAMTAGELPGGGAFVSVPSVA